MRERVSFYTIVSDVARGATYSRNSQVPFAFSWTTPSGATRYVEGIATQIEEIPGPDDAHPRWEITLEIIHEFSDRDAWSMNDGR